jgi:hypothetical protein
MTDKSAAAVMPRCSLLLILFIKYKSALPFPLENLYSALGCTPKTFLANPLDPFYFIFSLPFHIRGVESGKKERKAPKVRAALLLLVCVRTHLSFKM